jgi:hypothetical protein
LGQRTWLGLHTRPLTSRPYDAVVQWSSAVKVVGHTVGR